MSGPDARDERGLALFTDAARTRILTGVRVDAEERAVLERIVLQVPPAGRPAPSLTAEGHRLYDQAVSEAIRASS